MFTRSLRLAIIVAGLLVLTSSKADAVANVFEIGGSDPTSIQATVDAFRAALGNPNNGNDPGPIPGGRREINWDGGGATDGSPAVTPFNVFRDSRGATFTTPTPPGIGLTQTPITGGTVDIVPGGGLQGSLFDINDTYDDTFITFSPNRLFTPLGSNITDGTFSIPGTGGAVPATVAGFGAVFTDVDLPDSTSIEYFDATNATLGTFFVEPGATSQQTLSFLGVIFTTEQISRVRIITGNTVLGPNDGAGGVVDVVVMDDFIYGEPQALNGVAPIPEPATLLLLGTGLAGLAVWRGRQRRNSAAAIL